MERALAEALGAAPTAEREPVVATAGRPLWSRREAWAGFLLVLGLVAILAVRARRERQAVPASVAATPATPATTAAPVTVGASFLRRHGATSQRLVGGERVAPGDSLSLEFEASSPMHVYVLNEDERGESYVLFPLPELALHNPLPGGVRHVLPGRKQGATARSLEWIVSSAGGKEHLLIVASPERLTELEADLLAVPRPANGEGPQYPRLGDAARLRLRGIGTLVERPAGEVPPAPQARLYEITSKLASRAETVRGVWMRQVEFENPAAP
jgi:hypothetical protein